MFKSENSSSVVENVNVTTSIFHCPCPQVKACKLVLNIFPFDKILAGAKEYNYKPRELPGQLHGGEGPEDAGPLREGDGELHGGGGGQDPRPRDARPLRERDDRAGFSRS